MVALSITFHFKYPFSSLARAASFVAHPQIGPPKGINIWTRSELCITSLMLFRNAKEHDNGCQGSGPGLQRCQTGLATNCCQNRHESSQLGSFVLKGQVCTADCAAHCATKEGRIWKAMQDHQAEEEEDEEGSGKESQTVS